MNPFSTKNPLFEVHGIMIEFIKGYSLSDLAINEPHSAWQAICDEAINTVNLIGDHQILNEDVIPYNNLDTKAGNLIKIRDLHHRFRPVQISGRLRVGSGLEARENASG